jgi:hypothetical protein
MQQTLRVIDTYIQGEEFESSPLALRLVFVRRCIPMVLKPLVRDLNLLLFFAIWFTIFCFTQFI